MVVIAITREILRRFREWRTSERCKSKAVAGYVGNGDDTNDLDQGKRKEAGEEVRRKSNGNRKTTVVKKRKRGTFIKKKGDPRGCSKGQV